MSSLSAILARVSAARRRGLTGMAGLSKRTSDYFPTLGQAWERTTELFLASVLLAVLGSFVAEAPAAAQETAACEQYGCAKEKALALSSPPSVPASASAPAGSYEEGITAHEEPVPIRAGSSSVDGQPEGDPAPGLSADFGRESTEGPLPGYPYAGEPCEKADCGLEAVEYPVRCATYETASGQEVLGCAHPKTYERKGCSEVTFYTEKGKPYANLDTCSGEKPYAPPEPPEGRFRYWDPPDTPREPASGTWPRWDQCQRRSGAVDYHCGLEGLSATWVCAIFYDTVHGTVRGCYVERKSLEHGSFCIEELHLYDEVGKPLHTYRLCPEVDERYCAKDRCAVQRVPDEWWCRTEEWDYGELYGGERRVYTRCADPLAKEYLSGEIQPKPNRMCGYLWDERGRVIEETECAPGQGDSQVGLWAGKEAEEADATLNDHNPLASPPGGSPDPEASRDDAPEEQGGLVSVVVNALTDLLDGRRSSADPQSSASVVTTEVGTDEPDNAPAGNELARVPNKNAGADPRGAGAGSASPEAEIRATSGSTGSSSVYEAAGSGTLEAGGNDLWSSRSGERAVTDAEGLWLKIPGAVRERAAWVVRGGIVKGWLEVAAALAGLGAVGGAFAVRRRFLG
jgi:hypothetical protein